MYRESEKSWNEMTWKEQMIDYLEYRYADYVDFCKKAEVFDDRGLFVNIYEQIKEAINSLADEPVVFVRIAMRHLIDEHCKTLDNIVEKIENGLWGKFDRFAKLYGIRSAV